jgi:uncharacterized protein (TIGR02246 family)
VLGWVNYIGHSMETFLNQSEVTHIVTQIHQAWAKTFHPIDPVGMASHYSEDAILYGSAIALFSGREGVQKYFEMLPEGLYIGVKFAPAYIVSLTSDVISMAGSASFFRQGQDPLEVRITQVFVERNKKWLIASHHVSPKQVL